MVPWELTLVQLVPPPCGLYQADLQLFFDDCVVVVEDTVKHRSTVFTVLGCEEHVRVPAEI